MNNSHENDCFVKARALGEQILATGYGKRVSDAYAALPENPSERAAYDVTDAERTLRQFTEQVISVLRATVTGETDDKTDDKTDGCHACPKHGCH